MLPCGSLHVVHSRIIVVAPGPDRASEQCKFTNLSAAGFEGSKQILGSLGAWRGAVNDHVIRAILV